MVGWLGGWWLVVEWLGGWVVGWLVVEWLGGLVIGWFGGWVVFGGWENDLVVGKLRLMVVLM